MSKIITIANQKGGCGKSTICLNLAYALQSQLQVGLLDIDLQGSLFGLYAMIEGINLISGSPNLSILKKDSQNDIILIDSPPYLTKELAELFKISDFILIPTKAGIFDVMAMRDTLKVIENAENEIGKKLNVGIALNMVKSKSIITKEILTMLEGFQIPIFKTQISDRVSYIRSPLIGGVLKGNDQKAKEEILNLASEIIDNLN